MKIEQIGDVDMHRGLQAAGDAAVVQRELALGAVERDHRGQVRRIP
jgi:hypothetical protein